MVETRGSPATAMRAVKRPAEPTRRAVRTGSSNPEPCLRTQDGRANSHAREARGSRDARVQARAFATTRARANPAPPTPAGPVPGSKLSRPCRRVKTGKGGLRGRGSKHGGCRGRGQAFATASRHGAPSRRTLKVVSGARERGRMRGRVLAVPGGPAIGGTRRTSSPARRRARHLRSSAARLASGAFQCASAFSSSALLILERLGMSRFLASA